jgi:hypothetical protein
MSGQGGGADASPASGESGTSTVACDRACLLGILQKYLDALAARDLTRIAVSTGVKYTENGTVLNLGDGLWKTASMIDPMERLDFADPPQGQVASQVVVYENGSSPVIYQVRLRVVNGEITEIEAMAVRQQDAANGFFDPANMKPQPVFLATIDPASRMTRDQLKTVVDLYIDYLDGMTNASGVPFDANCARYENGVETATPGSFATQAWSFNVVRRYLVFDEEAGIAWGLFPFTPDANTLVVGEAFKVMSGNIMMIQAVMANMPANAWN